MLSVSSNELPQKIRGLIYLNLFNIATSQLPGFVLLKRDGVIYYKCIDFIEIYKSFDVIEFTPIDESVEDNIKSVLKTIDGHFINSKSRILLHSNINKWFIRPCPIRPRHGFVESRPIDACDFNAIKSIMDETLEADPQACLLIMPYIEAMYNAVITKAGIAIGPGHDGATAGKNSRYYPFADLNIYESFSNIPETIIKEHPYFELVAGNVTKTHDLKNLALVQLRDGQKPPSGSGNFIPRDVNTPCETVINTDDYPDLLVWEDLMKMVDPNNTIILHPGGSRVSHYAHHAIAHNIPVVFDNSVKPYYEKNSDQVIFDSCSFDRGLLCGMIANITTQAQLSEIYRILFAAHNASVNPTLLGAALLGRAVITLLRVGAAACLGEYRHYKRFKGIKSRKISRDSIYTKILSIESSNSYLKIRPKLKDAFEAFKDYPVWNSSYGGLAWARCTKSIIELDEALRNYCAGKSNPVDLISAMHRAINQAHNNGWWLNKFANTELANHFANAHMTTQIMGAFATHEIAGIVESVSNSNYINIFTREMKLKIARAKPIVNDHSSVNYNTYNFEIENENDDEFIVQWTPEQPAAVLVDKILHIGIHKMNALIPNLPEAHVEDFVNKLFAENIWVAKSVIVQIKYLTENTVYAQFGNSNVYFGITIPRELVNEFSLKQCSLSTSFSSTNSYYNVTNADVFVNEDSLKLLPEMGALFVAVLNALKKGKTNETGT